MCRQRVEAESLIEILQGCWDLPHQSVSDGSVQDGRLIWGVQLESSAVVLACLCHRKKQTHYTSQRLSSRKSQERQWFYLLKLSIIKEEVGSIEVSEGIFRVEADSGLVVLHGTSFISHELLDQTSICEELLCMRVTLKREKTRSDTIGKIHQKTLTD